MSDDNENGYDSDKSMSLDDEILSDGNRIQLVLKGSYDFPNDHKVPLKPNVESPQPGMPFPESSIISHLDKNSLSLGVNMSIADQKYEAIVSSIQREMNHYQLKSLNLEEYSAKIKKKHVKFNGGIKVKDTRKFHEMIRDRKIARDRRKDMPAIPVYIRSNLNMEYVNTLWEIWTDICDSVRVSDKDCKILTTKYLKDFVDQLNHRGIKSEKMDISRLSIFQNDNSNSYLSFLEMLTILAKPTYTVTAKIPLIGLPRCCARRACAVHTANISKGYEEGSEGIKLNQPDVFHMYVLYNKLLLKYNGSLIINNVPSMLQEERINCSRTQLDEKYWNTYGDFFIENFEEFFELVDNVRTDKVAQINIYQLRNWHHHELSKSEVLLLYQHFILVDDDSDGKLNEDQLVALFSNLGCQLSAAEAIAIITDLEGDSSVSITFSAFMSAICQIKGGNRQLIDNHMGKALQISNSEEQILHHLAELEVNPVKEIEIKSMRRDSMSVDALLHGPVGSVYEGFDYHLRIIFDENYPKSPPLVSIQNRILCVNMITQLPGYSILDHLKYIWTDEWNIRTLFNHIIEILKEPEYSLLPIEMQEIIALKMSILEHQQMIENDKEKIFIPFSGAEEGSIAEENNLSGVLENDNPNPNDHVDGSKDIIDEKSMKSSVSNVKSTGSERTIYSKKSDIVDNIAKSENVSHIGDDVYSVNDVEDNNSNYTRHDDDGWSISSGEDMIASSKLPKVKVGVKKAHRLSRQQSKDANADSHTVLTSEISLPPIVVMTQVSRSNSSDKSNHSPSTKSRTSPSGQSIPDMAANSSFNGISSLTSLQLFPSIESVNDNELDVIDVKNDRNEVSNDHGKLIKLKYKKMKALLRYLSRVEQMHVNTIFLYQTDKAKFQMMVQHFAKTFVCDLSGPSRSGNSKGMETDPKGHEPRE